MPKNKFIECRGSSKGAPKTDNCKPVDYDGEGWPLGFQCAGKGCGAWICGGHAEHFIAVKKGKKTERYCRICVESGLAPQIL